MSRVLWIFNHYIALPPAPGGVRHLSLARQLNRLGWDVSLICASSTSGAGDSRLEGLPSRWLSHIDGIRVISLDVPGYEGNGPRRIVNMSAFGAEAALASATKDIPPADIIIGSSVHPLAAAAGAIQARRLRVPFVFEIRDLWPETFVRLGRMRESSLAAKSLYALEARLWARASMIVSPLGQIPDYESHRGLVHRPFLHIPNGVATRLFDAAHSTHDGPLRLGYFGSHGNTDYLETIVRAVTEPTIRSRSDDYAVHLFGSGPHKATLRGLARDAGATNVQFHEPVGRDKLPAVMHDMDAFLFPLGDSRGLYRFGASPNKLQDYMAAGRPILMNAPFEGDPVTASGGGGIIVPHCTPSSWADAFDEFLRTSPSILEAMGSRVRRLAETTYDFEVLGERLARGLRSVLGEYR